MNTRPFKSIDRIINKYGPKIKKAVNFLGRQIPYQVKIYEPILTASIYDNSDSNFHWSSVPILEGRFIVTGIMGNTSPSSEIIDPFSENESYIYFVDNNIPKIKSRIDVIIVDEVRNPDTNEILVKPEVKRFKLGAEDFSIGGSQHKIYRRFILQPLT